MSYIEKNKGKVILIVGSVLVILSLVIYFIQKKFFYSISDLDSRVYPAVLHVGDTLHFEDNTSIRAIKKWEFGDGDLSLNEKGYHIYKQPGFYQVSFTVNDKYTKTFSVEVKQKVQQNHGDYFTQIEAPTQAMQYENIVFRAVTDKASMYSWKFGETGNIDAKEPLVIYAYQEPGDYEVFLYTDDTAYPVIHRIKVHPSFKNMNEELEIEDVYKAVDDDFKYHLQQIANGATFNQHYNYLVNKYLCQNENASVSVNTSKVNSFYYYCMGLKFDKNVVIQSVKVGFDEAVNCVTKVNVVQSK